MKSEALPEGEASDRIATAVDLARRIRVFALTQTSRVNSSHIGACLSVADILAAIYSRPELREELQSGSTDREVVILSKGHAAAALYGALSESGVLDPATAARFADFGSHLLGHASHHVPGVEFSTGALGHGLPIATGVALAKMLRSHTGIVTCILGDGECNEGSVWEAAAIASHHGLNNLRVFVDVNRQQGLGATNTILNLEPLEDKWQAFGWSTMRIDAHDHAALILALAESQYAAAPTAIIADSVKGKGVAFMENRLDWHYKSPNPKELELALKGLAST